MFEQNDFLDMQIISDSPVYEAPVPERPNAMILIIDGEASSRLILGARLQFAGYKVASAADAEKALLISRSAQPSLIILDLKLPRSNGFALLQELRKESDAAILVLTSVTGVESRILGLELGADDFVLKPFSPSEVEARIRAILRRKSKPRAQRKSNECPAASFGELNIDYLQKRVYKGKQRLRLTGMEFNLLEFLVKNIGQACSRELLLRHVFSYTPRCESDTRVIDVHISRLRQKIEENCKEPNFIITARGSGYMFRG